MQNNEDVCQTRLQRVHLALFDFGRFFSMTEATESSLIATREGSAGTILMNRPKALNALNQEMIRGFAAAIADWRHDASVKLALLEGAGGRAFCAGGDVRAVRAAALGQRGVIELL